MTGMPAGGLIASGQREVRCNAPGRVHTPLYYNYLAASIGDVHLIKLHALILRMSRGTRTPPPYVMAALHSRGCGKLDAGGSPAHSPTRPLDHRVANRPLMGRSCDGKRRREALRMTIQICVAEAFWAFLPASACFHAFGGRGRQIAINPPLYAILFSGSQSIARPILWDIPTPTPMSADWNGKDFGWGGSVIPKSISPQSGCTRVPQSAYAHLFTRLSVHEASQAQQAASHGAGCSSPLEIP